MNSVLTVYCDFDGTVTPTDILKLLLEELASPEWRAIEQRLLEGRITRRECLLQQIRLIRWDIQSIQELLRHVHIDPSFIAFAQRCYRKHIPLIIVSEGIQQIIQMLLATEGVIVSDVWANRLVKLENEKPSLEYRLPPPRTECPGRFCKCKHLNPKASLVNVLIGEEFNEPCWTKNADLIFARPKFQAYCHKNKIPHRKFVGFEQVQQALDECLSQIRPFRWKPVSCTDLSILNPMHL